MAIFGTTISPYLFYWQSSQEVEEDKAKGRRMLRQRQGATGKEIINRKLDVGTGPAVQAPGMFYAGLVVQDGRIYGVTCNLVGENVNRPTAVVCIGEK